MPVDNSLIPCRIDKPNPFEAMFALIYMPASAGWNVGRSFSDSRC